MDAWETASSELYTRIKELKGKLRNYSYKDEHDSLLTDERLCSFLVQEISEAKKQAFAISDLLFSLQLGEGLLPLTDTVRDELDIVSDEIKARYCTWKELKLPFMKKIVRHDFHLVQEAAALRENLEILLNGIITETKQRRKPGKLFWKRIRGGLQEVRKNTRELVVQFKEREALCNIHPLTLERSFQNIQKEIQGKV